MIDNNTLILLQAGANIVTILGIIFAAAGLIVSMRAYMNERKREHLEREYGTFDSLDNKYVEFMYACANHPNLDLFSEPLGPNRTISREDLNTERALFSVLISIFERAFVMFERRAGDEIKKLQYVGWTECMRSYCIRESFLHEWRKIGNQFDEAFRVQLDAIIEEELARINSKTDSQGPRSRTYGGNSSFNS
jgi:hypothetical protein